MMTDVEPARPLVSRIRHLADRLKLRRSLDKSPKRRTKPVPEVANRLDNIRKTIVY